MTSRKRGLSFARLLELSQRAAARYAEGDLARIELDEDAEAGAYVIIVLPEPRITPKAAPKVRAPRRKAVKAAAVPVETPEPDPEPPTPTGREGFTVIELPPVLPPRQRKNRRKKEAPAPQVLAPPVVPGSSPREILAAYPDIRTEADWQAVDLPSTAYALSQAVGAGLPEELSLGFHADVLALAGVDLDAAESCVRVPERVEIAEETAKKGYPVLRFHRGDVCSVIGFRQPRKPLAIAVYFGGSAFREYQNHGRANAGTGGGGGSRKESGIPRTGPTLMRRLRDMGATVTIDPGEKTATVVHKGQALGQVVIASTARRPDIEQAWQRTQRKIAAINQRA